MSSRSASTSEPSGRSASAPGAGERDVGGRDVGGRVVVVATPIGNLGDLSPRAVDVLASSDYIYCEDTRRTLKLLNHAGIAGPRLVSHHRHNEAATTPAAVARAKAGAAIALVTDAGTPLVSDPGSRLVRAARSRRDPRRSRPRPVSRAGGIGGIGFVDGPFQLRRFCAPYRAPAR